MKTEETIEPYTTLLDEMQFIAKEMKKAKDFMQEKELENAELKRDAVEIARELFISKLAYKNDFSNFEKRIAVYLLNPYSGESALSDKFEVLSKLFRVIHSIEILGEEETWEI